MSGTWRHADPAAMLVGGESGARANLPVIVEELGAPLPAGPAYAVVPGWEAEPGRPPWKPVGVLVLHGYGRDRSDGLALAVRLATAGHPVFVPDLPGHGTHPLPLTASDATVALETWHRRLRVNGPVVTVGFSLGARLAMGTGEPAVLVSPPGAPTFDGDRAALLKELRPQRVREAAPTAGLVECLNALSNHLIGPRTVPTLVVAGRQDLPTVKEAVEALSTNPAGETVWLPKTDHAGAWSHPELAGRVLAWIASLPPDAWSGGRP